MAEIIRDDAQALKKAAELAAEFRAGAPRRDAERLLPRAELDKLSASGLLAVTVPADHGGADVGAVTLARLFRLLASADAVVVAGAAEPFSGAAANDGVPAGQVGAETVDVVR